MILADELVKARQRYLEAQASEREAENEYHKAMGRLRDAEGDFVRVLHEFDVAYVRGV